MTPVKIYATFWFGFLLSASAVFMALTGAFGRVGSLALLLGGALGIWVVFVWRERASARAEKAQAQRDLARLPELERQMQSGKKAVWSTLMSAEMVADMRDGERQLAELERAGTLAETDPAAATAILDRLEKERRVPADPRTARAMAKAQAEMKELVAKHGAVEAMRIHRQRMDERRRQVQESAVAARRTHCLTWVVAAIVGLYLIVQIAWWIVH